jgi:hypothetical protein
VFIFFASSTAGAQLPAAAPSAPTPPSLAESLTGQAKDDYESGRILFDNADYTGALVKFGHAFELSSDVRLLWDMGACEKNLRHYVRVLHLVERYLHDGDTRISEAQRASAATVVRTVRELVSGIRLIVNEAGASVYVDDELVGTSPILEPVLVDLGDRRVRVDKPGFKEQAFVQHVVGAADVTVTVSLEHEARDGRLAIVTDGVGTIQVDGTAVGVGRWEGPVSAGTHAVRVTATAMAPYASDVAVKEGESRTLDVTLRHEAGGVSPVWWIAGGVVAAAGLGVGGYFLFKPSSTTTGPATQGTILPYTLVVSR